MRKILYSELVKNRFSIKNNEVIKLENGEFYNKQIAEQILIYKKEENEDSIKKMKEIDTLYQKKAAKKMCIDKYIELKNELNNQYFWESEPQKKYEIYKLISDDETLMLINTNYFPATENREVYYDKDLAIQIYENMQNLEQNIICSFPELIELYQNDVIEIQNQIEKLKIEDNLRYEEDMKNYQMLCNSDMFKYIKEDINNTRQENLQLKQQIEKANNTIKDLSRKLEISLNRVESLQNSKLSLWDKIKSLLKRTKRLP